MTLCRVAGQKKAEWIPVRIGGNLVQRKKEAKARNQKRHRKFLKESVKGGGQKRIPEKAEARDMKRLGLKAKKNQDCGEEGKQWQCTRGPGNWEEASRH